MAVTSNTSVLPDVYTTPIKPQYRPDLVSSSTGPLPKELRYEAAAGSVAALIDFCVTYPIEVARVISTRDSNSDWVGIIIDRAIRLGPWSLFRCIYLALLEPPRRLYRFVSLRHLRASYTELNAIALARTAGRVGVMEAYFLGPFEVLRNAIDLDEHWNPMVNLYRALHGCYSRPAAFLTSWLGLGVRSMVWNFSYYLSIYYVTRFSRQLIEPVLREPLLVHAVNVTCAASVAAALTAPLDHLRTRVLAVRPRLALIPHVLVDSVRTQKWRMWSSWPATVTRAVLGAVVFHGCYSHFVTTYPEWSDWLNHPSRLRNLAELTMYITEGLPAIEAPGALVIRLLTNPFGLFDDVAAEPVTMK